MNRFNVDQEDAAGLAPRHVYYSLVLPMVVAKAARMLHAISVVENWWDVLLLQFGIKEKAEIRMRSFGSFMSTRSKIPSDVKTIFNFSRVNNSRKIGFTSLRDKVGLDSKGKTVYTKAIDFPAFVVEFDWKVHGNLDVMGKEVVDIGAYVCETALYYAIEGGAQHVYSYEPFPEIFKRAKKNLELNPRYAQKITLVNEAVSGKTGSVLIDNKTGSFTMVSSGKRSKNAGSLSRIKLTSLEQITKKFDLKNDSALKVDCEGGEYEIFGSSPKSVIRNFKSIHIEYHYGYSDLKHILEHMATMCGSQSHITTTKG